MGNAIQSRELQVGDQSPVFRLKDQDGKWVDLRHLIGRKVLVIFFYPKDNTRVCTKEACQFRDEYEDFIDAGAEVVGISTDSVKSHEQFAGRNNLPYRILSDPKKIAVNQFGVPGFLFGWFTGRVTYIIDRNGIIRHITNSIRDADRHVHEALKVVKTLQQENSGKAKGNPA
ncbi:MAG: peroxiredoxin [Salibacteraceae bacterium]